MSQSSLSRYGVVVQAGPDEILAVDSPDDLNLADLARWSNVHDIVIALPAIDGAELAANLASKWGYKVFIGDPYNIAHRLLEANKVFSGQGYVVRVLSTWKNLDLEYVDAIVGSMQANPCDYVIVPRDFDVTMAADVASCEAIARVALMNGEDPESHRARFNSFGYMETNTQTFNIRYHEPAPLYSNTYRDRILSTKQVHPENEFFGRDYSGSRYDFLIPWIPNNARVLDIACGSGHGSNLISKKASFVLGCDYLESYVQTARQRYPQSERLMFTQGDAQSFVFGRGEEFDVVVSLHTLEHVENDGIMIQTLLQNLRKDGLLIIEVPILALRPLGRPINPFHLREYSVEEAVALVEEAGLTIVRIIGCCRGFICSAETARDAIQIHAIK